MAGLICLFLLPVSLQAQERMVSGRVTDANGAGLAGVSITIKQTNRGTTTDGDGKFQLTVPANATLVISSTGYKTQSIKVDNNTSDLQVKLQEDIARLDEVVVTGLATSVKRRNLSNAVATISSKQLSGAAPER
jgi:hypothetical protein